MNYKECLLSIKKDHGKGILLNKQQFSQVLFETISMCENENQLIKGAVDIGIGEKIYDLFGMTATEQVDELKLLKEIIKNELNYNDSDSLFVIQSLCIMCDIDCTEFLSLQDEEIKSNIEQIDNSEQSYFSTLFEKAESGIASSNDTYKLALCYANGSGVVKDDEKYIYWLKIAAEKGSAFAFEELADKYKNGYCENEPYGILKDKKKSFNYYELAVNNAEQPYASALYNLGLCYYEAIGVKRDYKRAFSLFNEAYNLPLASKEEVYLEKEYMLALCYYYGKGVEIDIQIALKLANSSSEKGNVESLCLLGKIYELLYSDEKHDEKSFKYYLQASKLGSAEAEYNISLAYVYGDDYVSEDAEKAFEWCSKAAEKNYPEALYQLADYYWDGYGVEQNKKHAVSIYIKAAEKGNLLAMSKLSHIYEYESDVVKTNEEEAAKWDKVNFETCFEKANEGCEDYYSYLSSCYRFGTGTDKNLEESLKWILLAVESKKDSIVLDEMVDIYDELGTVEKGISLYETIAAKGDSDIQYALAERYMDGKYCFPKDYKKALYWFGLVSGDLKEDAHARIDEINSFNVNDDEKESYIANDVSDTSVDYSPQEIADQLISEGHQVLEAIKLLREKTGLGLAEAKNYVEAAVKNNPNYTPTQKSGGCYVATCVYGSYDCPQVWTLRRFRDFILAKTWYGRVFVKIYYLISPQFVKLFGDNKLFKSLCKHILDKMVSNLKIKGFSDDKYYDIEW